MGAPDPFLDFVVDLFCALGPVSIRRMFGGAGVYAQGKMFALLADGHIYLKSDADLARDLEAAGSAGPFVWEAPSGPRAGQKIAMAYWRLPDDDLDDPAQAAEWGRRALALALSAPSRPRARSKSQRAPKAPIHPSGADKS